MSRLIPFLLLTLFMFTAAGNLWAADSLWQKDVSFAVLERVIDPVPVPIDSQWWDGFSRVGTTGRVRSFALHEGDMIVGGIFSEAGSIRTNGVARWDGSSWIPLEPGFEDVRVLGVFDGDVIAGVRCSCGAHCIWRWDGTAWRRMGGGIRAWDSDSPHTPCEYLPDYVHALAEYKGRLVAGGEFGTSIGNPDKHILQWDGEAWSSLGSTVNSGVFSLTVYEGNLVVGGRFTEAGEIPANRIAVWDGSAWSALGTGIQDDISDPYTSRRVLATAEYNGSLYVGGVFSRAGSLEADRLAYWDGTSWNSAGFEAGGYGSLGPSINALAVYDGKLIAGGLFRKAGGALADYIASWDGESWSELGSGPDGEVEALIAYDDVLLVGGDFTSADSQLVYNMAIWDGAAWHPVGGGYGLDRKVRALLVHDDQLIVGGNFHAAGDLAVNRIAGWDGSSWTALGEGWVGNEKTVSGLTTFEGSLVGIDGKVVKRWNGVSWDTLTTTFDSAIRAIEVYDDELIASGNAVAIWDGATWNTIGSLADEGYVATLRVLDEDLIAGGHFSAINGIQARNVAAWDGITWRPLGDGLRQTAYGADDAVRTLGEFDGDLVAGGDFNRSGTDPTDMKFVARWDGLTWGPLGRGLSRDISPDVYVLAEYNGTLVAGGDFRYGNGKKTWNIARFNGSSWHPIGSGIGMYEPWWTSTVENTVSALAVYEGDLYAGGDFKYAGGKTSFYMARWEDKFPGMVMNFTATPADTLVRLDWRNPEAEVFEGTLIRYSTSDYPAGPVDGNPVPNASDGHFTGSAGSDTFFVHHGLANGVKVYYSAFAYDVSAAHSMAALASAIPADSTAPGPVIDFSAVSVAQGVRLEWVNPPDYDFTEILISVSTSGYPADPDNADLHINNGNEGRFAGEPGSSGVYLDTGIWGGQTYYYSAWTFDTSDNQSAVVHDSVFIEIATPDTLEYFEARAFDRRVYLIWANPDQLDFGSTDIRFSTDGFPLTVTDGEPVPNAHDGRFEAPPGTWDNFFHSGLANDVTYYYSAFARLDRPERFAEPVMRSAVPSPSDVDTLQVFLVIPGDRRVRLIWTNPLDDDVSDTFIRYSSEGFPMSVSDGLPVPNGYGGRFEAGSGTPGAFDHPGLKNGVTYYYSGFVRLIDPYRYSRPTFRSVVPSGPDYIPPSLSVGVLQNPYLTRYLDIYLVASEVLDPASVDVDVEGTPLEMMMVGVVGRVWRGDYKLVDETNPIQIDVCASDFASNTTCVTARIAVGFVTKEGGNVWSFDDRLRLSVPPDRVSEDSYILVFPAAVPDDLEGVQGVTYIDPGGNAVAYRLSPSGLLNGGSALVEMSYVGIDALSGLTLDQIYIEHVGVGPLKSYVDPAMGTVSATVTQLGTFRLAAGEPGTSRLIDPAYLGVEQAAPNPFNASTSLGFEIRAILPVCASVYDIRGRLVATLMDGTAYPGTGSIVWDGRSGDRVVPSGVYFLKIDTPRATSTRKVVLIR